MAKNKVRKALTLEERVRVEGVSMRTVDIPLMSKTELVNLYEQLVPASRAHIGLERSEIEQALLRLLNKGERRKFKNPVDTKRDIIRAYLREHWEHIKDQLTIGCSGNCYECDDFIVISCYVVNQEALKERGA